MRFNYFTALLAAFSGTALAMNNATSGSTEKSGQITRPAAGDVIQAGSSHQIKWRSSLFKTGPVQILLQNDDIGDYQDFVEIISATHQGSINHFQWKVSDSLPPSDKYYIRLTSISDSTDMVDSGKFKIKASNGTSSASGTARAAMSTTFTVSGSATVSPLRATSTMAMPVPSSSITATSSTPGSASGASGTPSGGPSSTSTGGGSVATSFVPAPLALVGAVAVGMFAL
ncbi:hypothetical protein N7512_006123 [Penicillium capsulatum]|nr:hypothetical protein N7512_006123 [Penicillium capsulatum]